MDVNPAVGIGRVPEESPRRRTLEPEECRRLIKAADAWARPVIRFALETGLRLQELCRLEWGWLNLDGNPETLTVYYGKSTTRRVQGYDTIPLSREAVRIIRAIPRTGDRVFTQPNGKALSHHLLRVVRRAADAAGLNVPGKDPVTVHCLRRSFGTILARRAVDPRTLQTLMRHRDITDTLACYVGTNLGTQRAAVDGMGKALGRFRNKG